MKTASTNRRFICEYEGCYKEFNRRDYLERHAANHLEVKPYRCFRCDRQFSRKDLYDNHLSTKFHAKRVLELHSSGVVLSTPAEVAATIDVLKRDSSSSSYGSSPYSKDTSSSELGIRPRLASPSSRSSVSEHPSSTSSGAAFQYGQLPLTVASSVDSYQKALLGHSSMSSTGPQGVPRLQTDVSSPPEWPDANGYFNDSNTSGSLMSSRGSASRAAGSVGVPNLSSLLETPKRGTPAFTDGGIGFGSVSDPATSILGNFPTAADTEEATDYTLNRYYKPLKRISEIASSIAAGACTSRAARRTVVDGASPSVGANCWGWRTARASPMHELKDNLNYASLSSGDSWQRVMLLQDGIISDRPSPECQSPTGSTSSTTMQQSPNSVNYIAPSACGANANQSPADNGSATATTTAITTKSSEARHTQLDEAVRQRVQWVFSDMTVSKNDLRGYDRVYCEQIQTYRMRNEQYAQTHGQSLLAPIQPLSKPLMLLLSRIFPGVDYTMFHSFLESSWTSVPSVADLVHRPSFDSNNAHPALLAVLIMLSMYQSDDVEIREHAESVYPIVSAYIYELLNESSRETRQDDNRYRPPSREVAGSASSAYFSVQAIGHLQALCLMAKFEESFAAGDAPRQSLFRFGSVHQLAERFLQAVKCLMPALEYMQPPSSCDKVCEHNRKPVYATICREAYILHNGAERETQWTEWVAFESTKRLMHFAMYTIDMVASSRMKRHLTSLSLFYLDTHMICPDSLWNSYNVDTFYHTVGPSMVINGVPYLGIVKSLLRSSDSRGRLSPQDSGSSQVGSSTSIAKGIEAVEPISAFGIKTLEFALKNLLGLMLCETTLDDHLLNLMTSQEDFGEDMKENTKVSSWFNRTFQKKLFYSIEKWYDLFQVCHGPVQHWLMSPRSFMTSNITLKPERLRWRSPIVQADLTIPEEVLVLKSYRNASWISLSEDLPILLHVTSTLARYLPLHGSNSGLTTPSITGQEELLNFLYLPLYQNWLETDHAKSLVRASAELLLWKEAAAGQTKHCTWTDTYLSSAVYLAAIILWINDVAGGYHGPTTDVPMKVQNFAFIDEGVAYMQDVYRQASDEATPNSVPRGSIKSALLTTALVMETRRGADEPVSLLRRLVMVIEPSLDRETVEMVFDTAKEFFYSRHATVAD